MKIAYLVMEWVYSDKEAPILEVNGIFSSKEKAIEACLTENYFYGEFEIDKAFHEKGEPWPTKDAYPIKENGGRATT